MSTSHKNLHCTNPKTCTKLWLNAYLFILEKCQILERLSYSRIVGSETVLVDTKGAFIQRQGGAVFTLYGKKRIKNNFVLLEIRLQWKVQCVCFKNAKFGMFLFFIFFESCIFRSKGENMKLETKLHNAKHKTVVDKKWF